MCVDVYKYQHCTVDLINTNGIDTLAVIILSAAYSKVFSSRAANCCHIGGISNLGWSKLNTYLSTFFFCKLCQHFLTWLERYNKAIWS